MQREFSHEEDFIRDDSEAILSLVFPSHSRSHAVFARQPLQKDRCNTLNHYQVAYAQCLTSNSRPNL